MSATVNSDGIDLNSDFDLFDRENEPHVGGGVSGSAICVGAVETETAMEPMNGRVGEGVSNELSNDGLEGDLDFVDRASNVELGMRIVDNRGVDLEVGNVDTLPVMGGEIRVKGVEGREGGGDVDCGKMRVVENVGEVIRVVNGDNSSGVGAGRGQEETNSMEVDDVLGDTMCMGTTADEDVADPSKVADVSPNVSVVVASEIVESQTMTESVEVKTEYNRAMNIDFDFDVPEVGVAHTDDSVPDQDPDASVNVSVLVTSEIVANQTTVENVESKTEDNERLSINVQGLGVPEITGNEFNGFNLFVDLDSCMDRKGNSKSLNGIGIERTNAKYISSGEHAPRHHNGGVSSENSYKTRDGWSKHNGKKNRKLVSTKACVSDLVWGKVRSHPWWPGIIFDPSAATKKARKYYIKNSFLIAYFGDQTFAWNEASRIKPFSAHFSQMENQSNSEDFQYAVDCALDEVSRRVEFGLACSCLPDDLVGSIKSQIIVNAGIQKESSRIYGGDRFHGVDSFEPRKLVRYLKTLAVFPYSEIDRLEHIISQAQVLAFCRSKGCSQLPEFTMLGRLLEEDEEFIFPDNREHSGNKKEDIDSDTGDEKQVSSGKENRKCPDGSSRKHKKISGAVTNPGKKQKSLYELMGSRCSDSTNGDNVSGKLVGAQLVSSTSVKTSGKKRKAVGSTADDSAVKLRKTDLCASGNAKFEQSFRVGESTLRVVNQINGTDPVVGYHDESLLNNIKKSAGDSLVSASSPMNSEESQNTNFIPTEYCAPDEMLSRLWLAAKDPMKGYSFTMSVVGFFSEFRSSVIINPAYFGKLSEDAGESELCMEDAPLTKRIVQSIPEEQKSTGNLNNSGKCMLTIPSEKTTAAEQQFSNRTQESGEVNPAARVDGDCKEEPSLTALILNFTNLDSVPSITNLNRIYGQFGPLNESQTEVLKKSCRAKVVFKRRSDAETAFSSAGKYKIFGPSLVSYSLKYLPSTPSKASPRSKKKNRKDATSQALVKQKPGQP